VVDLRQGSVARAAQADIAAAISQALGPVE
jgi:hypothetical protein